VNAAGTDTADFARTVAHESPAVRRAAHTVTEVVNPANPIIITIDGPAGTGKSTVARRLAARIGLDFLDTGAMYRAATAIVIDHGLVEDLDAQVYGRILEKVIDADLHFDWQTDPPAILAWMRPLNDRIRELDVTRLVSRVAMIGTLRKHMVQKQRIIGHQHPRLVTEGRDQGSVAFPDAPVKFFLDAEPGVRARRRADQLREAGHTVDEGELLASIIERDRIDSTRADGPLICPEDAIRIDTSDLDIDGVVDALAEHAADILQRLEDEHA
jgi:cytidylate kinase